MFKTIKNIYICSTGMNMLTIIALLLWMTKTTGKIILDTQWAVFQDNVLFQIHSLYGLL